jgi:hypothetical protein
LRSGFLPTPLVKGCDKLPGSDRSRGPSKARHALCGPSPRRAPSRPVRWVQRPMRHAPCEGGSVRTVAWPVVMLYSLKHSTPATQSALYFDTVLDPYRTPRGATRMQRRCARRASRHAGPGGAACTVSAKMPSLFDFHCRVARAPSSSMPFSLPRPRLDEPPGAMALPRHGTLDTPGLDRDALALCSMARTTSRACSGTR